MLIFDWVNGAPSGSPDSHCILWWFAFYKVLPRSFCSFHLVLYKKICSEKKKNLVVIKTLIHFLMSTQPADDFVLEMQVCILINFITLLGAIMAALAATLRLLELSSF